MQPNQAIDAKEFRRLSHWQLITFTPKSNMQSEIVHQPQTSETITLYKILSGFEHEVLLKQECKTLPIFDDITAKLIIAQNDQEATTLVQTPGIEEDLLGIRYLVRFNVRRNFISKFAPFVAYTKPIRSEYRVNIHYWKHLVENISNIVVVGMFPAKDDNCLVCRVRIGNKKTNSNWPCCCGECRAKGFAGAMSGIIEWDDEE